MSSELDLSRVQSLSLLLWKPVNQSAPSDLMHVFYIGPWLQLCWFALYLALLSTKQAQTQALEMVQLRKN